MAVDQAGDRTLARRLHPWLERQDQGEDAAPVDLAGHTHVAAVEGGEPLRQRKPETRSFVLAAGSWINLVELVEDLFHVLVGDADSGIGN